MIHTLELTNYRGFERYKLSNLARVNLLVGKNNSGKTSILEAAQLLASEGDPQRFAGIARRRGEVSYARDEVENRQFMYLDLANFFFGRDIHPGACFSLRSDGSEGERTLEVEATQNDGQMGGLELNVRILGPARRVRSEGRKIAMTEEGFMSLNDVPLPRRRNRPNPEEKPLLFVSQASLNRGEMSRLWNQLLMEGRDGEVLNAMRILEPELSSIVFLSGDQADPFEPLDGILAGFEGQQRRHPLGSQGEGMRRLLALALALSNTRNGILLIDEVDTGLHYSVLGDVWLLIVNAAREFNIQVFLTTHSYDCVRALAWLCQTHPELGSEVSIQKIERAIDEAVALDAEQIQIAVEQDIEVR